jgi:pilus assembly protein CpaB
MNRSRVIVLVVAAFAAGIVALMVRGLLGGGTPPVKAAIAPAPVATEEVLVAATNLQPGVALAPESVRWQTWPKSAVDSSFIVSDTNSDTASIVKGTVARAPMLAGEPLTNVKFIHADASGFMAAQLSPGMRAVSISISTDSGAGGFILPNDRVDVILTQQISDTPRRFSSKALITNVRVLAMDQTFAQDKDQKTVLAKTATLELSPDQADMVARSAAGGTISLSLRPLGENDATADAAAAAKAHHAADDGVVTVIRYGIGHAGFDSKGE